MQPNIHHSRVVCISGVAQFFCKLLARRETAIDVEQLQEIDDRSLPVELFLVLTGEPRQHASTSMADCGGAVGALLAPLELEDVGPVEVRSVPGEIDDGLAPAWPKMVEIMFPSTVM